MYILPVHYVTEISHILSHTLRNDDPETTTIISVCVFVCVCVCVCVSHQCILHLKQISHS